MESENFNVEFEEVVNIGGGTSDFNELSNRPKYNNETMTGGTNIPEVPTKTSDLTNDGADGTSTYVEADDLKTVATTGDYNDLTNKPTIPTVNNATLTITQNGVSKGTFTANASDDTTIEVPNTTYSDFTGTDGTTAGTHGLVPAPATTDAGKFLKADGTWETVGGGSGIIELTTADYNYPTNNPTSVALWLLEPGLYKIPQTGVSVYYASNSVWAVSYGEFVIIEKNHTGTSPITMYFFGSQDGVYYAITSSSGNLSRNLTYTLLSDRVTQTTGTSQNLVMSQNATTSMVYADPSDTTDKIRIGNSNPTGTYGVNIGGSASQSNLVQRATNIGGGSSASANASTAIGNNASVTSSYTGSVALGAYARPDSSGQVYIGSAQTQYGYNGNSNYRLLSGLYDPQNDHDAATKGYVDTLVGDIETALNVINNGGNS